MDLYIATGPYHVFVALCLKLMENRDEDGCLLIVALFNGAETLYERVRASGAFKETYLMSADAYGKLGNESHGVLQKIGRGLVNRFPELRHRAYRALPIADQAFQRVFLAGEIYAFHGLLLWQRKHFGTKIYLFEDGLSSRLGVNRRPSRRIDRIKRFLGYRQILDYVEGLYFFSSEYVPATYPFPLLRQRRPQSDERVKAAIRSIFTYSEQDDPLLDSDMVYMNQGFEAYGSLKAYAAADWALARELVQKVDHGVIRLHPMATTPDGEARVYRSAMPFEVSCLFCDMDEKLLISPYSAALFNPKFIFDEEPYVALVYKLVGLQDALPGILYLDKEACEGNIRTMLVEAYRDKSRVCIPETKEELYRFIEAYKNRAQRTRQ